MILSWIPEYWGNKHESNDGGVAYAHMGPGSIDCVTNAHYFLAFFSTLPHRTRALNSSQKQTNFCPAGSFEILPKNSDFFSSWSSTKESLLIGLTSRRLSTLAKLEHEDDLYELQQLKIGTVDKKALFIAQKMKQELYYKQTGYEEGLDALLTLLGLHVLRSYSNLGKSTIKSRVGGLSPQAWSRINEFIYENLSEKLTIERMSEIALLSPSHFLRAFKETSGETPHQFILKARLSAAKDLIVRTDASFHEISKAVGFASNSHMTLSTKKFWGATPSQLRNTSKKSR